MEWYYAEPGTRHGPFSPVELHKLLEDAVIAPETLVWRPGQGDWKPLGEVREILEEQVRGGAEPETVACEVCGQPCEPAAAVLGPEVAVCADCRGRREPVVGDVVVEPEEAAELATGEPRPNHELLGSARERLAGNWASAIGGVFTINLLSMAADSIPLIGTLLNLAVSGPLQVGISRLWLNLARRREVRAGMVFEGFQTFSASLTVYLGLLFVVLAGGLAAGLPAFLYLAHLEQANIPAGTPDTLPTLILLALPAVAAVIYLLLRFGLVFFLYLDHPLKPFTERLRRSSELMVGYKWQVFRLFSRFALWALCTLGPALAVYLLEGGSAEAPMSGPLAGTLVLGFVAFAVGMLWLTPYLYVAYALFYDERRGRGRDPGEE